MKLLSGTSKTLTLGLALIIMVSGCTINIGTSADSAHPHAGHMMSEENDAGFGAAEIMFAQMMIPHHEQAVVISALANERAIAQEVIELANAIMQEQEPEIEQMKAWLTSAGAPMEMDHEMPMSGMLTSEELAALENSSGAEFEKLFLEGMIAHHEGAVKMAEMIVDSKNIEARELGQSIIQSQTDQIQYMRTLLENY